jgi:hypothetical protein
LNDGCKNPETGRVIASVSVSTDGYLAVALKRGESGGFEVVRKESGQLDGLREFLDRAWRQFDEVVFCAPSKAVAFYRIDIPNVPYDRIDSIVKMQSERLFPLPSEHVRFTWRAGELVNGQIPVTIAAARKSLLEKTIQDGNIRQASNVFLDCEGTVRTWSELFDAGSAPSIIIKMDPDQSRVLSCENGRLSHSAVIDIGLSDLSGPENFDDNAGLFTHDLRNVMEMFGVDAHGPEVFILSQPGQNQQRLLSYLGENGINGYSARFDSQRLPMAEADIYEYFAVLGTAMMALDSDGSWLELFDGLYTSPKSGTASSGMSLKHQVVFAAASLVVFLLVCFAMDKLSLSRLDRLMSAEHGDSKVTAAGFIEQQNLRKIVAAERCDVIGLLTKINECCDGGIMYDSFSYRRKDAKVSISGTAGSWDQLYKLEKALKSQRGIANVKIPNPSSSKDKVNYTITFNYGKSIRGG